MAPLPDAPAPFRITFDQARDPYAARVALGAATNPVSTAQISDNAITTAKLADGSVTTIKIAADAVDNTKLANMAQATVKGRAVGAGTGDPTDLTAAQVSAIVAPAWTSYTPTITALSGTFTSVSATGRYSIIGKTTHLVITIVITTNGSAATAIRATLPNTAVGAAIFVGRENAAVGHVCIATLNTTTQMQILKYDNTYPGGNGYSIDMAGVYENT